MDLSQAIEVATATHEGMVREHNEDALAADAQNGLVVLADGMGGYNAGEVASGIAVSILSNGIAHGLDEIKPHEIDKASHRTQASILIEQQINLANAAIFEASETQAQCAGMGTTLVMALFYDNKVTVAHIGDSRLYRLRGDELKQITRDHSLLQEQIDGGVLTVEQARYSQNKNLVTRALGIDPTVESEIHDYDVEPGDIYLLCSDGLNDMVEDDEISLTLQTFRSNLSLAAEQLVQMANDNGGRDNVSIVLVKIAGKFAEPRSWASKFISWFE